MSDLEITDSPLTKPGFSPPPPDDLGILQQIAASISMPFAFSHCTAARILGWPVPWVAQVSGDVHVMTRTPDGQIRTTGFVGHRGLESRDVSILHDLPVVAPAHTWVDLGELVGPGLPYFFEDIIGSGDQALNRGCTKAELRALVESRNRPRGKRTLLPALVWMRKGSESMLETQWRLCCQRARLPQADLNRNRYAPGGRFLFRPDLSWLAKRIALECQGAQFHDTPEAAAADGERMRRGSADRWTFHEVRSQQLWDKSARDTALMELADSLEFPARRLDLVGAEPMPYSPEAAETLRENLRRRNRLSCQGLWLPTR